MKRLVIVGASGPIGRAISLEARRRAIDLILTYCRHPIPDARAFDLAHQDFSSVVPDLSPDDTVLMLAAIADQGVVFANPNAAYQVNVIGVGNCLEAALRLGAHVIFVSSEAVFGDRSGDGYDEAAAPHPVTTYGLQKAAVERRLLGLNGAWSIARCGWTVSTDLRARCPIKTAYGNMRTGAALLATDILLTITAVEDVARALIAIAALRKPGIFHLASNPPLSFAELGAKILAASTHRATMGYRPVVYDDLSFREPRARRAWLRSARSAEMLSVEFSTYDRIIAEKVALLDAIEGL